MNEETLLERTRITEPWITNQKIEYIRRQSCNTALSMTLEMVMRGAKVAFFTLAMRRDELAYRLLSIRSSVPLMKLLKNMLSEVDLKAIIKASDDLMGCPLYMGDSFETPPTIADIQSEVQRLQESHVIDVVVIDCLAVFDVRNRNAVQPEFDLQNSIHRMQELLDVSVYCFRQDDNKL